MADREKVMQGLDCCAADSPACEVCPYAMTVNGVRQNSSTCTMTLTGDALDLLEEQRAMIKRLIEDVKILSDALDEEEGRDG